MAIKKVERVNVSEQVFGQMRQQLIEREWLPGEKLPSEDKLSQMFGVSKVTIRQALQKLIALNLIETRLGDGSYVREADQGNCMESLVPVAYLSSNLKDIMQYRRVIEPETAAIAARMATAEDIAYLRETIDRIEKEKENIMGRSQADLDFHYKIACITGNPLIIRTYDILNEVLKNAMVEIAATLGSVGALQFHPSIVDAVEAGDEDRAAKLMKEHLTKDIHFPH